MRRKRPGEPGPVASYCSHVHRRTAYARRWPLGAWLLRDLGLDPSLALAEELQKPGLGEPV
jgi:hypothetical protein